MRLEEPDYPPLFDAKCLLTFPPDPLVMRTVKQFNAAVSASSSIDKYLNLYKVLESLYWKGRGRQKVVLRREPDLRRLIERVILAAETDADDKPVSDYVDSFIDRLVDARDKCSHLKARNRYGYAPYDRDVY